MHVGRLVPGKQWDRLQTADRSTCGVVVPRQSGRDAGSVDLDTVCLDPSRTENAGQKELRIRPGAKALVSDGEYFLLVKERRSDGSNFWTLPGGGRRPGESAAACLRRELVEELQCQSHVNAATGTFAYRHTSQHNTVSVYTVFRTRLQSRPKPNKDEGILECQWVEPANLPETTLPQVRCTLRRGRAELRVIGPINKMTTQERLSAGSGL